MKKQTVSIVLATVLVLLTSASSNAEQYYFGVQYVQFDYEQSNTGGNPLADDGEGNFDGLVFLGGYNFTKNIALEGRLGINARDDEFTFTAGGSTDIEVGYIFSILGKFSLGGKVSPYALVGFTDYEVDASDGTTAEGNDISFGAGVDFAVTDNAAISLEYIQYANTDISGGGDADLSGISLGVNFKF